MIRDWKYRKKYPKRYDNDEKLAFFAMKIVGSTALFFMIALGVDAYKLFH